MSDDKKSIIEFGSFNNYIKFQSNINVLKELNGQLAKSLEKTSERSRRALNTKLKKDPEFNKKLSDILSLSEATSKEKTVALDGKTYDIFNELIFKGCIIPERLLTLIRNMGLVYLIAEFEDFLRNTLETVFFSKPETLYSCKKL